MATHKNTTQSRMFVLDLTEMNVIPGVETDLWKRIMLKKNMCVLHCMWRLRQKKQCSYGHYMLLPLC